MRDIRNILVIRLSSIGDIVLTTPVLRRLHAAWPTASIDYCVKPAFLPLLERSPYLQTICTTQDLPSGHYDLVVDLQNNLRSRGVLKNISYDRIYRYRKQNWKKLLLVRTGINFYGSIDSVVDRYMASMEADDGIADDARGCELWLKESDRTFAARFAKSKGLRLGVCFGARHLTKRYPPGRFASVIEMLSEKLDMRFFLLGGTEDVRHADEIIAALSPAAAFQVDNLAGSASLMESAALLEVCDAVLCNDTGLMHIASAFGKQLFVLFGSSVPEFGFLPYKAPFSLFDVPDLPCRPCSHIGKDRCPKGHLKCMTDIAEESVAEEILDFFKHRYSF